MMKVPNKKLNLSDLSQIGKEGAIKEKFFSKVSITIFTLFSSIKRILWKIEINNLEIGKQDLIFYRRVKGLLTSTNSSESVINEEKKPGNDKMKREQGVDDLDRGTKIKKSQGKKER